MVAVVNDTSEKSVKAVVPIAETAPLSVPPLVKAAPPAEYVPEALTSLDVE
jgi:hypothetical protein